MWKFLFFQNSTLIPINPNKIRKMYTQQTLAAIPIQKFPCTRCPPTVPIFLSLLQLFSLNFENNGSSWVTCCFLLFTSGFRMFDIHRDNVHNFFSFYC